MDAERLERAVRALLRVVDEREFGLRGYYIDAARFEDLRDALAAQPAQAWRDSFPPTHYCRECKALWRRWPDGSWSLVTAACGKCCDNVPMGEQIVALGDPCAAPASAEAVAREAADLLAEMDAAWPPSQPPPHPKSFQGRFQARVRAVAHALRVRGGR